METYHFKVNSNAAPIFSDPGSGFIEASDPMTALRKVVADYGHPCGLYSASIIKCSPDQPVLANYLSARAATSVDAPCGTHHWEDDKLLVDDVEQEVKEERYEEHSIKESLCEKNNPTP